MTPTKQTVLHDPANRLKSDATPAELRLVLDYMEGRR